jgi:hypothetical protein
MALQKLLCILWKACIERARVVPSFCPLAPLPFPIPRRQKGGKLGAILRVMSAEDKRRTQS